MRQTRVIEASSLKELLGQSPVALNIQTVQPKNNREAVAFAVEHEKRDRTQAALFTVLSFLRKFDAVDIAIMFAGVPLGDVLGFQCVRLFVGLFKGIGLNEDLCPSGINQRQCNLVFLFSVAVGLAVVAGRR